MSLSDDYEWYQGRFEVHIQELHAKLGLQFLKELRRTCPDAVTFPKDVPTVKAVKKSLTPAHALAKLKVIAPGFQA